MKEAIPQLTVIQLVIGIQDLLDNPNISDPAQIDAYQMFKCVMTPLTENLMD